MSETIAAEEPKAKSNTSELARVMGVSHTAVRKARDKGRITPVGIDNKGAPLYDTEQAMADWANNTNQANKRAHKEGGRPRLDGKPTKPRADLPSKPLADQLVPGVGGAGTSAAAGSVGEPDGEINYNKANAREKHYKALIAQLEYEQKIGQLVPIADVAKEVDREYSRVRARLLAIPSVLAHDLALSDDIAECRTFLETAINDALNELTADAVAPNADA